MQSRPKLTHIQAFVDAIDQAINANEFEKALMLCSDATTHTFRNNAGPANIFSMIAIKTNVIMGLINLQHRPENKEDATKTVSNSPSMFRK